MHGHWTVHWSDGDIADKYTVDHVFMLWDILVYVLCGHTDLCSL